MEIIDVNTVKVDSFADLSSILTANDAVTYIYLGVDIDMTSGIRIHNDRSLVVIDGEYPPGSGVIHTLRDAGDDSGMIHKDNISALDITFKNMTITGRDYFGMPRIADGNTNVTVTYQNVDYTGPQITWHWSGLTRYIDCDITIMYAGYSPSEEAAQICQVEIGGKTTINHNENTTWPVFSFYKTNASLTILEDAEVEISTNYDFFTHELPPVVTIQPRASLKLTTQRGISRGSGYRFASFLVDKNASFHYTRLSNSGGAAALYLDGPFTANEGARVYMQSDFTSTSARGRLIQFTSNSSARRLDLNNPKSFVLYTSGIGTSAYFSTSTPFSFTTEQVNFWRDAGALPGAGSFEDYPLYPWHNPDWSNFEISGSATTDGTTVDNSTLTEPVDPDLENLKLQEARVLSVGELPLEIYTVVDDQTPVTGQTDPYANIIVVYTDESGTHTSRGTADGSGKFSIPTPTAIPLGTTVYVSANVPFLYKTATAIVKEAGELYIESAPPLIQFTTPPLSPYPMCILGRDSNEPVVVIDNRFYSTEWELVATLDAPMFCPESSRMLPGQVVFVPPNSTFDDEEPLDPQVSKRVHVGGPYVIRTEVKWDDNMGILLRLTGALHFRDRYRSNISWTVSPIES